MGHEENRRGAGVTYRNLIVDGSFLARRPWEAAPDGEKRRVMIQSVVSKVVHWLSDDRFERVAIAWDGPPDRARSRCLRRERWEDYKSRRPPTPRGFVADVADLREHLGLFGVVQVWSDEGEADDVAAALALGKWPGPSCLWAADKDWLQAVTFDVDLLRPDTSRRPKDIPPEEWRRPDDRLITFANIVEETGLSPDGWGNVLALAGDTIDGIPGLPRVGKGRAEAIVKACPGFVRLVLGGLENDARAEIMRRDASLAKWVEVAIEHRALLQMSADLVALNDKVEVVVDEWDPGDTGQFDPDEGVARAAMWLDLADLADLATWARPLVPSWQLDTPTLPGGDEEITF